jgi:carbonic anhydrase
MKSNLLQNVRTCRKISKQRGQTNVLDQVSTLDLEPILHKKYSEGDILIVGAVYDIHTGKVNF